ncbi:hypothetical protein RhiirC2_788114 [Rhizophagus irregularis]|uniref:Uncharacterized protein n=1 Tax=Rhizophagus irregularis TaxID=588596 RepID=A0A2N1MQU3_9GLOM|nr:hypothetical protein RhiirC2_788114 [Rhizophagus irregularis]
MHSGVKNNQIQYTVHQPYKKRKFGICPEKYGKCPEIFCAATASELITCSIYTGKCMIDESKTTTLPSFIRTENTYFNEKPLHINAMIREFRLPSLFITLTAAESK